MAIFVGQVTQNFGRLLSANVQKACAVKLDCMCIHPGQTATKLRLKLRVAGCHKVDEFADAGFARTGRVISRDDQLRQTSNEVVFFGREKLRWVSLVL